MCRHGGVCYTKRVCRGSSIEFACEQMNRSPFHVAFVGVILVALGLCGSFMGCRQQTPQQVVEQSTLPEVHRNAKHPERYFVQFDTMGTYARFEVVSSDRDKATAMLHAAYKEAQMVHVLMSTYRENSDISRLNKRGAEEAVEVSSRTLELLKMAKDLCKRTGGAFEPTYAPLRELWRKAQREDRVPSQQQLANTQKLVGSEDVILEDGKARLARQGMEIDLGGIAKGYGIDQATETLLSRGAKEAMVDIGGDMRVVGRAGDDKPWKIGIRCPEGAEEYCPIYLALQDIAVATSGDYARGYVIDGKRYSHIIDPRTGKPVPNVPSVTVIAQDAATADALATGITVMGSEKAMEMVESMKGVECLLLVRNEQGKVEKYASSGFSNFMWRENNGGTQTGDSS